MTDHAADLELIRWRQATGRQWPGEPVPVGVTLDVGRFHFEGRKLPAKLVPSVVKGTKVGRSTPKHPPLLSIGGRSGQLREYNNAMASARRASRSEAA